MDVCGNTEVCCDGAQQGCCSAQQLPCLIYRGHKEEKIPMENCSAGKHTAHYRSAPCWNDTITSIWAISDSMWASRPETLWWYHWFCMFHCKIHIFGQFRYFSWNCQATAGVLSFQWNMRIRIRLRLVIYHKHNNGTFRKGYEYFYSKLHLFWLQHQIFWISLRHIQQFHKISDPGTVWKPDELLKLRWIKVSVRSHYRSSSPQMRKLQKASLVCIPGANVEDQWKNKRSTP